MFLHLLYLACSSFSTFFGESVLGGCRASALLAVGYSVDHAIYVWQIERINAINNVKATFIKAPSKFEGTLVVGYVDIGLNSEGFLADGGVVKIQDFIDMEITTKEPIPKAETEKVTIGLVTLPHGFAKDPVGHIAGLLDPRSARKAMTAEMTMGPIKTKDLDHLQTHAVTLKMKPSHGPYKRGIAALQQLLRTDNGAERFHAALLNQNPSALPRPKITNNKDMAWNQVQGVMKRVRNLYKLNEEQNKALYQAAVELRGHVGLIVGHAGCGKTVLAIFVMLIWLKLGIPVLSTSATNTSADKLAADIHRVLEEEKTHDKSLTDKYVIRIFNDQASGAAWSMAEVAELEGFLAQGGNPKVKDDPHHKERRNVTMTDEMYWKALGMGKQLGPQGIVTQPQLSWPRQTVKWVERQVGGNQTLK